MGDAQYKNDEIMSDQYSDHLVMFKEIHIRNSRQILALKVCRMIYIRNSIYKNRLAFFLWSH